jgi:glycerol-3-phosphate acyltransferase PlsY
MDILHKVGILVLAYLIGSIPWGFLVVKILTGKDVRKIESGRTGGTNTMRAAGFIPGLITSLLDIFKSAGVVWFSRYIFPDSHWFHVWSAVLVVIGHNYSIFLLNRDPAGKLHLGGGAGGTPAAGGIIGLWWPSLFILIPTGFFIVMVIGYASLATISLPLIGSLIFLIRFYQFNQPWQYIFAGLIPEILILWALRPNIKRLINGTERIVGFRAKKNIK